FEPGAQQGSEVEGERAFAPGAVFGGGDLHRAAANGGRDLGGESVRQSRQGRAGRRGGGGRCEAEDHGRGAGRGGEGAQEQRKNSAKTRYPWQMSERVSLVDRIQQDLTAAMKAREAERTSALRMAKAALMNREIEKRSPLD